MMVQDVENWRPHKSAIPSGWDGMNFDDVFEVISTNGKKVKQKNYLLSGALPVVDQGAAFIGGYTDDSENKITVEKPVIVFGDHTKCFKLIDFDFAPGADGTKILSIPNCIDSRYLYYLCVNLRLPDRGYSRHFSFLRKSILPIAPLNEQKRIVDKIERLFSNLDEGEALLKQVQQQLAIYRQSVLKSAVIGELTKDWREANQHRLESGEALLQRILQTRRQQWQGRGKYKEPVAPDAVKLPNLPDGWAWISPDQVSLLFGNGLSRQPVTYQTDYPILRISAVRALSVDNSDIRHYEPSPRESLEKYWIEQGDLLFTRYNGSLRLVGVCGLYNEGQSVLHPDKIIKLRTIDFKNNFTRKYLELCLNAGESRAFIRRNIKTTAGQQGIAGSELKLTPIPFAPFKEQLEIINIVEGKLSQIDALETWCATELARSASLRQSILKDAFSGKLVEHDPNDEPASELLKRIQAAKAAVKKAPARKRQ